ncbi:MAG: EamA family transporter [Bacteroidales bacterium]|nr:EamA family transporter [Bacteroidales bacterium]
MWVFLAFVSAAFLGLYDVAKKKSLTGNNVLAVLFCNTMFCALIFMPFIIVSKLSPHSVEGSIFNAALSSGYGDNANVLPLKAHLLVIAKAFIVLSSWIMGYFALKHLPITITGPINATRPVLVLIGAVLLFSEKLNLLQWGGVIISLLSLFLLSLSGKKEGIDFKSNKWVFILFGAVIMGAASGLYDKFIMKQLPPLFVQSWFNIYQVAIMGTILAIMSRLNKSAFKWSWWIPLISIFISIADFAYFYALSDDTALIAVISMIRRGSVVISFTAGALLFKEKNLKAKAFDLVLILIGLVLLYFGSTR